MVHYFLWGQPFTPRDGCNVPVVIDLPRVSPGQWVCWVIKVLVSSIFLHFKIYRFVIVKYLLTSFLHL